MDSGVFSFSQEGAIQCRFKGSLGATRGFPGAAQTQPGSEVSASGGLKLGALFLQQVRRWLCC